MSGETNLSKLLATAAPGATITIPPGEYNGAFIIDKPVTICGSGPATVFWSTQGPVFKVRAGPVCLRKLSVEVTDNPEKPAIQIESASPVQFDEVRVRGKVNGLPPDQAFEIPAQVEFGVLPIGRRTEQPLVITVPDKAMLTCNCTGLTIEKKSRVGNQTRLQLIFEAEHLSPGMLIDGLLEVHSGGITTAIRLIGEVQARPNTVAGQTVLTSGSVDPFTGMGRDRTADVTRTGGSRPRNMESPGVASPAPVTPTSDRSGQAIQATVDWYLQRIRTAESQNDYPSVRSMFEELIMLHPEHIQMRVEQALFFERRGDFAYACSEWEIIQRQQPTYPDVEVHLARGYMQTGRIERVIQILEGLLPRGKPPADVYKMLAQAYHKAGRLDEAIWSMQKAQQIAFDPKTETLLKIWQRENSGA